MAIDISKDRVQEITLKLLDYCRKNDWAGYDPYDALNSKLFRFLPFLDFRLFRIGLTQLLKRSPINIRPLLLVPKMQNPKAIALFLMSFLKLEKLGLLKDKDLIPLMVDRLIALRSPQEPSTQNLEPRTRNLAPSSQNLYPVECSRHFNSTGAAPSSLASQLPSFPASQPWSPSAPPEAGKPSGNDLSAVSSELSASQLPSLPASQLSYCCWGYSFPWQTRTILVPRWSPNLVCTTFVANALLDVHERNGEQSCLEMALSAAEYILKELYWTDDDGAACFAYPLPSSRARVHNANFLGAALLCRAYKASGDSKFLEPALKVARYSAAKQHDDGSWDYGEHSTQQWIDNFHTGYNICALQSIGQYADTSEFEPHIRRGFDFYREHFFREDGAPKYFHDRTYPIDIHSVAQSIITLVTLGNSGNGGDELAKSVFGWAAENVWDERGFFYYQTYPLLKIKTPYMRWSQAWMLYALATYLSHTEAQMGQRE